MIGGEPNIKQSVGIFRTKEVKHFRKNFEQWAVILEAYVGNFCVQREYFDDFIIAMTSNLATRPLEKRLETHPLVQSAKHVHDCMMNIYFMWETIKDFDIKGMTILHKNIIFIFEVLRSRGQYMEQWKEKRIHVELRKILESITKKFAGEQYVDGMMSSITTLIITTRNVARCCVLKFGI